MTRYFTRLCTIILSTCVIFLVNLDDIFAMVCTSFHEILVCTRYVPLINSQEHKVHHPPCTVIIYHHLYIYITTKEIHTPGRSRTIAKGYKLPYLSREVKLPSSTTPRPRPSLLNKGIGVASRRQLHGHEPTLWASEAQQPPIADTHAPE